MSIISQMLKDLERRKQSSPKLKHPLLYKTASAVSFQSALQSSGAWLNLIIIILLIMVCFLAVKMFHHHKQHIVGKPLTATSSPTNSNRPVPSPVLSTLVHAIGIAGNQAYTRLTVYFNKPAKYKVERDLLHNTLTIILDNTQLGEPLLPVKTANTAIKNLQVKNVGTQLLITLTLNGNVEIQNVQLDEKQQNELLVDLADKTQANNLTPSVLQDHNPLSDTDLNGLSQAASFLQHPNSGSSMEKSPAPLNPEPQMDEDWSETNELDQQGDTETVVARLQADLATHPDRIQIRQMLGSLLIQQHQLASAGKIIHQGLLLAPKNSALLKLAAQIYVLNGDQSSALATLEKNLPPLTDDPDYYAFLADLYLSQNQPIEAAKWYGQLADHWPNNGNYWLGLAASLEATGKSKAALDAYQNASMTGSLTPALQAYVETRLKSLGG